MVVSYPHSAVNRKKQKYEIKTFKSQKSRTFAFEIKNLAIKKLQKSKSQFS